MRSCLVLLIAFLAAWAGPAFARLPPRVPLVGYVDRTGKVVEPATYESASLMFRGDWVAVSKGGKGGYLNLRTRASTGLVFDSVADDYERVLFAHGLEPAQIGDKWGFVDETGKVVIPPRFDGARGFGEDGLAIVRVAGPGRYERREGFIDKAGTFVVPARYEMLRPYGGGLAVFRRDGKWGAIDREGREVVPARFGFLGWFGDNGLAPASLEYGFGEEKARFGYIDRTGRFVIPPTFVHAGNFKPFPADGGMDSPEGLARVALADGQGAYVDSSGKVVTRFPAGVNVWGISPNGLVRIQDSKTAKYGFADRSGAIAIPPRFDQAGGFDKYGLASVQEKGKAGYIRADGSWAIEPRFSTAGSFDEFGQAQAEENGQSVLIDRTGAVVAKLPAGANFYWQRSQYTAFKIYPPKVDFPPERFGRWVLERTLHAVPEYQPIHGAASSSVRLTFRTADGTVRWGLRTEGWTLDAFTEEGPEDANDVSSQNRLTEVPTGRELIALLGRQLLGSAEFRLGMTPGKTEEQAAQGER
ncbi:MAG TPA: WG repeat-containing protein, partial [Allosphingosinicella sp.]|nr:WG repeat-containing protein [Allosphingosinicella sp.]